MISFLGRSFCSAACRTTDCPRNFTPELQRRAEEWWGGPDAPVAYADFHKNCALYLP